MKREEPDERKEESLITIAKGNALDELDFVIESLELTGRNAHSHLETFGGERGRFIMDRIKCHKNEYKIILGCILKRF